MILDTVKCSKWSRTKISEKIFNILEGYQNIRKLINIESTKISEKSRMFKNFSEILVRDLS